MGFDSRLHFVREWNREDATVHLNFSFECRVFISQTPYIRVVCLDQRIHNGAIVAAAKYNAIRAAESINLQSS